MKVFRLPTNRYSGLINKTITFGQWIYGIEPIIFDSTNLKIVKVRETKFVNTYEIKRKIEYRDIKTLLDDISKSKVCTFKGTNKSQVIKIYIDNKVYYTRTKGRLKVKNGKFKTNLDWIKKELVDRGLVDNTPPDFK